MALERKQGLRRNTPKARAFANKRSRIKPISDKKRGLLPERAAVRERVHARDRGCVGPRRGLPGDCAGRLDVHEVVPCGRDSTSWLDEDRCVVLCRFHHNAVTSAHGAALVRARAAGLDVKAGPLT